MELSLSRHLIIFNHLDLASLLCEYHERRIVLTFREPLANSSFQVIANNRTSEKIQFQFCERKAKNTTKNRVQKYEGWSFSAHTPLPNRNKGPPSFLFGVVLSRLQLNLLSLPSITRTSTGSYHNLARCGASSSLKIL